MRKYPHYKTKEKTQAKQSNPEKPKNHGKKNKERLAYPGLGQDV